ncbi:MAG: YARHG domain-containing protein [Desulfobacterales bacterium]|nr:YARHG domain-containing protein [Desulfobacterales bacterium]
MKILVNCFSSGIFVITTFFPCYVSAGTWGVQVFASRYQNRAEKLSDNLADSGYPVVISKEYDKDKLLYKIRVGKFRSKKRAGKYLKKYGKKLAKITRSNGAFLAEYKPNAGKYKPIKKRTRKKVKKNKRGSVISRSIIAKVIRKAKSYKGCPYLWGGNDRKGIDCSGLMKKSFESAGIVIPRTSRTQAKYRNGKNIMSLKNLRKGDMIFFDRRKGPEIDHVGLVTSIKNRRIKFIHSSGDHDYVKEDYLEGKWRKKFVKGKRVCKASVKKFVQKKRAKPVEKKKKNILAGKYPQTSLKYLTVKDLKKLTKLKKAELAIMRNEIFARHGYKFHKKAGMQEYFNSQSWYKKLSEKNKDGKTIYQYYLSDVEKHNVNLIRTHE